MPTRHKRAQKDKRAKLDLELFLIALIEREIDTPYLLHASAALSPGATIPVLNKLNASGYVQRGKPGLRGRAKYETTPAGLLHLRSGWRSLLDAPIPTDVDAILRIASLAILCGAARKTVTAYLRRAAGAKTPDPADRAGEVVMADRTEKTLLYPWMKAAHVKARRTAEAKVLRHLASAVLKKN